MLRYLDLFILAILAPLWLPIFALTYIVAYLLHDGDVFFTQNRLGKDKVVFRLYKFRSMVKGAENMGTGLNCYTGDHRITSLGRVLRATSLDELPQIYNVILGDMSIVGPRPAVVGELELEENLPEQIDLRFNVRPGLTGWAQIHGRDNLSWFEKASMDIYFVKLKGYKRVWVIFYVLIFTPLYLFNFSATYEKRKN